jgi:hypothetical protein
MFALFAALALFVCESCPAPTQLTRRISINIDFDAAIFFSFQQRVDHRQSIARITDKWSSAVSR